MKTEALYSIVYISEHDTQLSDAEFKALDILQCQESNKHRISGCLTAFNGNVVQVLEGEHSTIAKLFDQIKTDQRHKNLTIIWSGTIRNRNFSEYNIINFCKVLPAKNITQKAFVELKIQSFLNNHEKNIAQSIFLETLKQMS